MYLSICYFLNFFPPVKSLLPVYRFQVFHLYILHLFLLIRCDNTLEKLTSSPMNTNEYAAAAALFKNPVPSHGPKRNTVRVMFP